MRKHKSASYETLSKLIISAIEDEQFFNKKILVPKVLSILKGFKADFASANYNKIESPSESARRLRTIEKQAEEVKFWKSKAKLNGNDVFHDYCKEIDQLLAEKGLAN